MTDSRRSITSEQTLVSAHDLGGANQLLYATKKNCHYHYALTGPAIHVAESLHLPNIVNLESVNLANYSHLLVASNLEEQYSDHLMIEALSRGGIRVTGYLDHWVNYEKRWRQTPHKVVVSDLRAFIAALPHFGSRVRLHRNHYLVTLMHRQQALLSAATDQTRKSALLILQPIGKEYKHEVTFAACFCRYATRFLEQNFVHEVTLRNHVGTDAGDCRQYLMGKFPHLIFRISDWRSDLEADLVRAFFVIGTDSYALYVADKLGKIVYSVGGKRSIFSPRYPRL